MQIKIFFYGDSNTWGYIPGGGRIEEAGRFPFVAGHTLGRGLILADGLNGRCTAPSHPLFPPELLGGATFAASLRTVLPIDALVIMLGTNDVMPPLNLGAADIAQNVRQMLLKARELAGKELPALVIGPPRPSEAGITGFVAFGEGDRNILSQDLAAPLAVMARAEHADFLNAGTVIPAMDAEDGFHLLPTSHKLLGKKVGSVLANMLSQAKSA